MEYWLVAVSGPSIAIVDVLGRAVSLIGLAVLVVATIVLSFLNAEAVHQSEDNVTPEEQINCPSCGARLSEEADTCAHCSELIDR
ncbi:MAG: hypothetical protein ACLFR6_05075 [Salinarchaeum sp.]